MGSLRIAAVSLDCSDHAQLARFYVALLNGELLWSTETSSGIRCENHVLVMQQVDAYEPPTWPGTSIVHLDLAGDGEIPVLTRKAIALGARAADEQPDERWTVMLDPAGHPFCITPLTPGSV